VTNRAGDTDLDNWPISRLRQLLQPKLLRQLSLPTVIGFVQLGAAIMQVAASPPMPSIALWLVVSFAIGFSLGSAVRIAWDDRMAQVVLVGNQLALTLGFIIFNLGSRTVLEYALADLPSAGVSVLLVASGLLLGHSVGLSHRVHGALT